MTKPNPAVRYFVGKFKEAKRGSYHHVVRRTTKKGIFGKKNGRACLRPRAWKKAKAKYGQVSNLFPTRALAREEKRKTDGR